MRSSIKKHFDTIAESYDYYKNKNKYYYDNLKLLVKNIIVSPEDRRILECGCGTGNILDYLNPQEGIGIDISEKMIRLATEKHKEKQNLTFLQSDIENETIKYNGNLDFVLMIDILEHLKDPISALRNIKKIMRKGTELLIITANRKWRLFVYILDKLRVKIPEGDVHWFLLPEVENLLKVEGFMVLKSGYRLLIPSKIPFSDKVNDIFYRNNFLRRFGLIQFAVARIVRLNLT